MKFIKSMIIIIASIICSTAHAQNNQLDDIPDSLLFYKKNIDTCNLNAKLFEKENPKVLLNNKDAHSISNYKKDVNIIYEKNLKCYNQLNFYINKKDISKLYNNLLIWKKQTMFHN